MHRISFTRMLVAEADRTEWESAVKEQVRRVSSEPGTILYGFMRRAPEGSTLLPAPRDGFSEYLHFQCYQDPAAFDTHLANEREWWTPLNARFVKPPRYQDRFEDPNTVAVVSRDYLWAPENTRNFGFLRFKVPSDRAADFEADAKRQIDMVIENEPGTLVYGFIRRPDAAGGLLPRPLPGITEYVHFSAYQDEAAWEVHHSIEHREGDWAWGRVYRSFIAAPLETEPFPSAQIVAATSRYADWPRS